MSFANLIICFTIEGSEYSLYILDNTPLRDLQFKFFNKTFESKKPLKLKKFDISVFPFTNHPLFSRLRIFYLALDPKCFPGFY